MVNKDVDVLIIGGGLTGATLMLALQGLGFTTLLVESKSLNSKTEPDFDARSLALSPASVRILNMLGVWEIMQEHACKIDMIHVSDQHYFGASRLHAEKDTPLGYVVEMHYINKALHQTLPQAQMLAPATLKSLDLKQQTACISTDSGEITLSAQLIIAADGAASEARNLCGLPAKIKEYQQHAIVANIGLTKPHQYRAFERFTAHGPLALLPMQDNRMSLVWALPPHEAKRLMSCSDTEFIHELQKTFGYRLGRLTKIGKRMTFPLKQLVMPQQASWPVLFVGNAAHTLHPVAGQGFNLGLRDVAALAQCITRFGLTKDMMSQYLTLRRHDQQIITNLTDGLISLFTSKLPGIGFARSMGLVAFDNIPALKKILARYARGFGGVTPDLVCEIALDKHNTKRGI